MSYVLKQAEKDVLGEDKYIDKSGNTECVVFVQKVAGTPSTKDWKPGIRVADAKPGSIRRGTAIATFDKNGKYPTDLDGKHAAIYLGRNSFGIQVLDQWKGKGEKGKEGELPGVSERTIHFNRPTKRHRSNRAETFYVIE